MPTPVEGSPGGPVTAGPDAQVNGLVASWKWGTGGVGTGAELGFSFAHAGSDWSATWYGTGSQPYSDFAAMDNAERAGLRNALQAWAAVADLVLTEVVDPGTPTGDVGELRIGYTSHDMATAAAYAFLPGTNAIDGDTWFNVDGRDSYLSSYARGTVGFQIALHEFGHALGLSHPHEPYLVASPTITGKYDSLFYTVMSYNVVPGAPTSSTTMSIYPTTPMALDISAMQYLYGANDKWKSGNTLWKYDTGQDYLQTIWDAGGSDTFQLVGNAGRRIDLDPGSWSWVGDEVRVSTNSSITSYRQNVFIHEDTVIEHAIGGGGNDVIDGNAVANQLKGGNGNDTLVGDAGNDRLFGGGGRDRLTGDAGNDLFVFNAAPGAANVDDVRDFASGKDRLQLEDALFAALPAGVLAAGAFRAGSGAGDAGDRIIYDRADGLLYYDADGKGGDAQVLFARLGEGTLLRHTDIVVV